jgi:crotonobetaine/carnitine-CoA ligase
VQIFPSLMLGLPCGIDDGFTASRFWDRVRHYGATQLLTMGATHIWLWNQDPADGDASHPGRVWAPVPLPSHLHEPFKERFGIEHLWSTYGGTEFMSAACTDVRRPLKPGASGRARQGVELAVMDDRGRRLPPGQVGELCVRPTVPHAIFQGYHGMPEETLRRFRDLWFHTGDLVRIDAEGELTFVDRKDDYLRVRGENVSSFEVESAFLAHPAVAEAAAYSIRSAESALVAEDEIMVSLVPTDGATMDLEDALRVAAANLPHFAVPRFLDVVEDLPRTATGRIQKHVLRDRGTTPSTFDRVRANVRIER